MKRIVWDESLSVGVAAIDEQHQKWIAYYNSVADAVEARGGQAPVMRTVDFLINYTDVHFKTEESFMRQAAYPDMADHVAKHGELRQTIANLVTDFQEEGQTTGLEVAVETLLGNWLVNHIRDTDQLFGRFVKENNIILT